MTNDQINAAISQLYGWSADYCHDLNAMNEVEKSISDEFAERYAIQLSRVTGAEWSDDRMFFCASARERAEAFLRMMGKWPTDGDHLRGTTKKVGEVQLVRIDGEEETK